VEIHDAAGGLSAASLIAGAKSDGQGGTILALGSGHDILMNGIQPGQLSADWFLIGP
jgi:hypothetical protein